jgi:hypothetical protein
VCIPTGAARRPSHYDPFLAPGIEAQLTEDLQPLAAKWRHLGTQLSVPATELDAIAAEQTCSECLRRIIQEWLKSGKKHTKADLVEVLKKQAVGETRLANRISAADDKVIPDDFDNDKTKSTGIICEELSEVAYKYRELGLQLLGSYGAVKKIEDKVKDVKRYLGEMIAKWLANVYTGHQPFTDVLVAIRSKSVNDQALANKLEKEWQKKDSVLPAPEADGNNEDEEVDIQKDV